MAIEYTDMLTAYKCRITILRVPRPLGFVVDNCCTVRAFIQAVFEGVKVCLDIWHLIHR